jgi:hypothetical protein
VAGGAAVGGGATARVFCAGTIFDEGIALDAGPLPDNITHPKSPSRAPAAERGEAAVEVVRPVQNTTEEDQVTFWLVVYAALAVSLLVFAIAHHIRCS